MCGIDRGFGACAEDIPQQHLNMAARADTASQSHVPVRV